MSEPEALAYFLDEEQLESTLPGWPRAMNLVLCLDEGGGWSFLVYHEDEIPKVLERVAEVLGRPIGTFGITPQVDGHPTRRVLFSEEQQLLAMLARTDRLVETAQDYAINYNFALEEGLDPEEVTRRAAHPTGRLGNIEDRLRDAAITGGVSPREETPATPEAVVPDDTGIVGADPSLWIGEARLAVEGGSLLVTLGEAPDSPEPVGREAIGFREDFDRVRLREDCLPSGWTPGGPLALALEEGAVPEALLQPLRAGGGRARIAVTGTGLHLGPLRPAGPVAPAPERVAVPRRRAVPEIGWRVRLAALVGLCLVSALTGALLKDRVVPVATVAADR